MTNPRDRSVEQGLQKARLPPAAATSSCLDPEVLAAWADGGLSGAALESAQVHVADCDRCQDILGAMMRTEVAVPTDERAAVHPWRRWLTWAVPATAAAAVVAISVWLNVPDASRRSESAAAGASAARERSASSLPTPPPAPGRRDIAAEPVPGPVQAAAPPAALATAAKAAVPEAQEERQGRVAGAGVAAAATDRVAAEPAAASLLSDAATSDDPARWRIRDGAAEHSNDGGATWTRVATGVTAVFTAVSAPGGGVCWLAGGSGIVLLTIDGESWAGVNFPDPVDLVSVRAVDASQATVTASDGRTYSTVDGGVSWATAR